MSNKYIVWFEEVGKNDVNIVGGKGANLGEMTNSHLPIPYGFVITAKTYFEYIKHNDFHLKISQMLKGLNYENSKELSQVAAQIRQLILSGEIPKNLAHQIVHYYDSLQIKEDQYFNTKLNLIHHSKRKITHIISAPLVAVRSSATAEDLPDASFAGQQETFLNVKGESHLLHKVKECFASLFTDRAVYYRFQQKFDHMKVGLAVVVQRMVQSDKSGIAFSIDPVNNDKNKIVIEAIFGLGEYIVQGKVTPDHYEVDKKSLVITKIEIKRQTRKFIKANIDNREVIVGDIGKTQKLNSEEITKVALTVRDIENHYFFPQDIEWAIEKDRLFIVQSRPITTIKSNITNSDKNTILKNSIPVLIGSPASPGIGVGPVKIIFSPKEINKINQGDVLVAPQTNPDYVPAMKKACAIVTEKGGRTSHAAIVSRELGIPAVVGAERATKILKNNQVITVNGQSGEVFSGKVINTSTSKKPTVTKSLKTLTRLYVNMAQPDQAKKTSQMNVDGIGLLRAEFIIADIGVHPKEFIKHHKQSVFINSLYKDLLKFVAPFSPRPVVYRATDFKTNEYRNLKGGQLYEPKEENPLLGYRGAYRYITNPDVFNMELEAIKKVWQKGYHNLHLMIPFVRVPWELIKIKELVKASGLTSYPDFKLWMMVEVPSAALNLEEFLKIGVDGVSIGTNDLTMMLLGLDRDSEEVAPLYDERTPVIQTVLKYIVSICKKYHVTCSICGQAPSDYPEIAEMLVKEGITSLSINPDVVDRTRQLIFDIEKKLSK